MLTLVLVLALALPAAPPAMPVQATHTGAGLTVDWRPPAGQVLACAYRLALPNELLGCASGRAGQLQVPASSLDAGFVVAPGDTVGVRSYDDKMAVIAAGEARSAWRVWFPWAPKQRPQSRPGTALFLRRPV